MPDSTYLHNGKCCPGCKVVIDGCRHELETMHRVLDKHIIEEAKEMGSIHGDIRVVKSQMEDVKEGMRAMRKMGWGLVASILVGSGLALLAVFLDHMANGG